MSSSWGTELWDQFDNLEKHTSWGIDFLEKYSKFVKERAEIELSYAKQIRSLSKKYHPKRSRGDESRYTWCLAFAATLHQLNEVAVQREELAENLNSQIVCDLTRFTHELKTERKTHFQDGRRAQQHIESSWKQLESSKRRFERDCKEAERAQQVSDRIDLDNKTDGEKRCSLKARHTAQQKQQAAEESRKDYVTSLNQFNQDQHQHYHTLVPVIYQRIQDMEERRIERICESMRSSAEAERKVLPVVSGCLDAMMDAAESIQPRMDTRQVVEVYKSGFDPPGDVEFEDYSATMRRSISESSYLDNRTEGRRHGRKLWPFLRKNKLLTLLSSPRQPPPPPPTSPSPGDVVNCPQSPPPASRDPITQRLNDLMTSGSRTRKQCLRSLKRGLSLKLGSSPADCSHLSPEQRRKKLQTKINNINEEIQREREQRTALMKMKTVYEHTPQGDSCSLDSRLEEVKQNLQRLDDELRRNQAWLSEVDSRLSDQSSRRQSGGCGLNSQATTPGSSSLKKLDNRSPASRESPDGSYTEDHSAELHFKSRSSEFDEDFDDEEPLPSIATCRSLYPFQGQNEGTLSMVEGELLSVVEEDKGDGWTRVRRNLEEEGYVPTSYIKVFLDTSAKGFVQSSRLV
ncbi:formin-binding protein 1-like isoform X1 [Hippoglossus hippoglossus]|uniref:formin-binding protein 1-like isoform X1 n=1 Tax=Hippoglossus hippoglossus TaxID=8267 RepID=UPI00148CCB7C|nr:formin-binding protein 1-like isoform X1 [Hippoglossus hippoglossus]XP_034450878.1 formin-binding protein 1-like isoform X1 [Hippoglossus hippoglossus]